MKILLFPLIFICFCSAIFFSSIQSILFNANLSWYWSNIMPYLLCALCTLFALALLIFVKIKPRTRVIWIFAFLSTPPILFALHPIYAGDFTNNSAKVIVKTLPTNQEDLKDGLTMISLANCTYCYSAMQELKVIKKRVPNVSISIAVLTTNSAVIDYYNKETDNLFNIFMIDSAHLETWSELSPNQQFPCFLYLKNKEIRKKWSNQEFGYAAKDFIEQH